MFFIESTKMYEVTDHVTMIGHNNFTTAVMANKDFFDGLSEEDQQVIRNAIDVAFDHIIDYQDGLHEASIEKIRAAKPSVTFTTLTEEQRAPFKEAARKVEARFIEMTGERGQAILEQMKEDLATAQEASSS